MSSNVVNAGRSTNKRAMMAVIDLSDDDESTNTHPVMKSLKTDMEQVPSQEVLDLRQKVAKLEKDFEGACVYARQFELDKEEKQKRVECLENLLGNKPATIDAFQSVSAQELHDLREKVAKLEKDYEGACLYARQFELEKEEKQKRVEYLENLLEKKPAKVDDGKEKKLSEELEKTRDRVSFLTKQLEAERSRANEDRMKDRARIDELTHKLKQYEGAKQEQLPRELQPRQAVQQPFSVTPQQPPQPLQAVQQQQLPNVQHLLQVGMTRAMLPQQHLSSPARSTNVQPLVVAVQKPTLQLSTLSSSGTGSTADTDPKNFFELLPKGAPNSVALPYANQKLRVGRSRDETLERGNAVFKGKKLHCSACDETFEDGKILEHFFSRGHRQSVIVRWPNNAVSSFAVNYWIEKLWSTPMPGAAAVTVAPPAPTANDGASTNAERAHLVDEIDE